MSKIYRELIDLFLHPESYYLIVGGVRISLKSSRDSIRRYPECIEFTLHHEGVEQLISIPMSNGEHMRLQRLKAANNGEYPPSKYVRARFCKSSDITISIFAEVLIQPLSHDMNSAQCSDTYDGHLSSGTLHEERVVVEDITGFGYVDSENKSVIPSLYRWADRFREGRAEVESSEGFGLIDTDGNVVIPTIYESLGYNPDTGLTIAKLNGRWAYFSYCGEQLTPFTAEYPDEDISLDELRRCFPRVDAKNSPCN